MIEPTDKIGNITLYNADCMEVMKQFKDKEFDLAIVDPPYGIDIAEWDKERPTDEYWEQLFRVSKNQIIFGGNYFTDYLYPTKSWVIWDKKMSHNANFSHAELAWVSIKGITRMFRYSATGNADKKIHPTEKPIKLYKWLLQNYAKEGDTILDTHFGSLSIGIACHDMGFELTAIELDKDYYQMAKKRLLDYKNQLTIEF